MKIGLTILLLLYSVTTIGQDCKYYQDLQKKKRDCTRSAKEWLAQNHDQFDFKKHMPVHAFELDYDEGNMDMVDSLCDIGSGYFYEGRTVPDSVQYRIEKQLDVELEYRLMLLIKKESDGKCQGYLFELYQGFQWHVLEFYFNVVTLKLQKVEFIDENDCKRRSIVTSSAKVY